MKCASHMKAPAGAVGEERFASFNERMRINFMQDEGLRFIFAEQILHLQIVKYVLYLTGKQVLLCVTINYLFNPWILLL